MIKPEILAPAGSFDALRAAVWAGADAVYLGAKSFSARAGAANFSMTELEEGILFAHRSGVKVYVTVNTLLKEKELEPALHLLRDIYNLGADAAIIQDLGAASLAKEYIPQLEIHASTQTTTTSLAGIAALRELGFDRVVLARELTAVQIIEIAEANILPVEIFLHGALCVAYSGQCLHSSLVGGRSGNRGQCAQPCRLPYSLSTSRRQGYLLSPRDLCLIEQIPLLASLGCAAWKIEGRARSSDYVAETVGTYRRALDAYWDAPHAYIVEDTDLSRLEQSFNRQFTTAYLTGKPGRDFYSGDSPANRGLSIGVITGYQHPTVKVRLDHPVHALDVLSLGPAADEVQAGRGAGAGERLTLTVTKKQSLQVGETVRRLTDTARSSQLRSGYKEFQPALAPLCYSVYGREGGSLLVKGTSQGKHVETHSQMPLVRAAGAGLSLEIIEQQLGKLGASPFYVEACEIDVEAGLHLPVAQINECRRQVVSGLSVLLWGQPEPLSSYAPLRLRQQGTHVEAPPTLGVSVANSREARAAAEAGADWLVFGKERLEYDVLEHITAFKAVAAHSALPVILRLPRIMHSDEEQLFAEHFIPGIEMLTSSLGGTRLASSQRCIVRGDSGLNIFNSRAVLLPGLVSATISPELNKSELREMVQNAPMPLEVVVHGRQLLMVHENCILQGSCGGIKSRCSSGGDTLTDRKNLKFPVFTDYRCRSYLYNSKTHSLIDSLHSLRQSAFRLRLEVAGQGVEKVRQAVSLYGQGLFAARPPAESLRRQVEEIWGDLTRGHWQRGVT